MGDGKLTWCVPMAFGESCEMPFLRDLKKVIMIQEAVAVSHGCIARHYCRSIQSSACRNR